MANEKDKIAHARKDAHLDLAKSPDHQAQIANPFDAIQLCHEALPNLDLNNINISTRFCEQLFSAPFFIGAMTGGTDRADAINQALIEVASEQNIPLALGSQRASLASGRSQKSLRQTAPDAFLIGNLGITQLAAADGQEMANRAIEDIEANAMAIHLNPAQEAAQMEGDHDWRGVQEALAQFIATCPIPVIVKEVGAGINATLAANLWGMGASYVDVAGLGGTNWTRIEAARHQSQSHTTDSQRRIEMLAPFLDWGLDTTSAIEQARHASPDGKIIASGGIRHGLDVAKSLALGADMVCAASPFLKCLEADDNRLSASQLSDKISIWAEQIKLACFLTNSPRPSALRGKAMKIGQNRPS